MAAGWLGEYMHDLGALSWDPGVWAWDTGLAIYSSIMSYGHRPRGGSSEDPLSDHDRYPPRHETGTALLERLWAEAGNEVKWRR